MPQIKSAIKRVKTSEKSRLRNISYKSKIKTTIKKFELALSEKNKEEIGKYFKDAVSILDKSVNKGILPKNTASRQKASLTKKLNTLLEPGTVKKSAPAVPKKAVKVVKKPAIKKVAKPAKKPVTKKAAAPKKKTETTETTKTKVKPTVKKTVKAAKKPAAKKTETKKVKE
ncbi:MAG: 30S ribosomal protein S20 [Candidatus Caldatribacteriota bacterium]|nr:30S ribosomal protein S20 [Candidatus Caldatribacteriota bacterium]